MDMEKADKAHRLSKKGKTGPEIAKALGLQYAQEAHHYAAVGRARAHVEAAKLTEGEALLLRCLAEVEREMLSQGEISSPKGKHVSWRARKADGWAAATAAKRLGHWRKGEEAGRLGTGLNLLHASRNGHIWLTPAGWAFAHCSNPA